MKTYYLTIILLVLSFSCTENKKENKHVVKQVEPIGTDICYQKEDQNLRFSFDETLNSVVIVSYNFPRKGVEISENPNYNSNILEDGKIGFKQFREEVLLTDNQIDSLQKILLNYDGEELFGADCYYPRHCIYFKTKNDSVIAYLEVCYQCSSTSSNLSELRLSCEDQFGKLEDFMRECGIIHGLYGDRTTVIPDSVYNKEPQSH